MLKSTIPHVLVAFSLISCSGAFAPTIQRRDNGYDFAGKRIVVYVASSGEEYSATPASRVATSVRQGHQEGVWYQGGGILQHASGNGEDVGTLFLPPKATDPSVTVSNHPRMAELTQAVTAQITSILESKGYSVVVGAVGVEPTTISDLVSKAVDDGYDLALIVPLTATRSWNRRLSRLGTSRSSADAASFSWSTERGGLVIAGAAVYDTHTGQPVWAHVWQRVAPGWATMALAMPWDEQARHSRWGDDHASYWMELHKSSAKRAIAVLFGGREDGFRPLPRVAPRPTSRSYTGSYEDSSLVLFKPSSSRWLWQIGRVTEDDTSAAEIYRR